MHFSSTELDTLAVLRHALNSETEVPKITAEWAEIAKELSEQTVLFLTADCLSEIGVSEEEKGRFVPAYAQNLKIFHRIMQEQENLAKAMEGIPYVVLKGAAAAMYYPMPERRQMGDIDFLVAPSDYDKAKTQLVENGYLMEEDNGRHTGFKSKSGVHLELHQKFSTSDNAEQNAALDGMLYEAMNQREMRDVCGYTVPVLPKLENGLVLLAHINQHMSSGLGLRQIIDWMLYIRECLDDAFWKESFCKAAEAIGMRQLAEITTLLCKRHLGLEGVTWCDEADGELADQMLEYILSKGNFGRKNEYASRATVSVLHRFSNPVLFFRYLTAGGMLHWKAARKHKWLKPFAWIYQIGHIIKMGLKRKVRPSKFLEEAKQSKRETELLEKINVTRK